jgi:hypothetical protein
MLPLPPAGPRRAEPALHPATRTRETPMDEDVLAILMAGLIVFVPVAGITARFALKPLIDSVIRIAEMRRSTEEVRLLERRIALLEQEMNGVKGDMHEISEQKEFLRKLSEPPYTQS